MASIFTRIINGELPAYKIAETDDFIAFLDAFPNVKGHTLCVPKKEIDKIFDMDPDHYLALMEFSRKIALAIEETIPCNRVGMAVVGLEVPHVHVHLLPLNQMRDIDFKQKAKLSPEEFEETARTISSKVVL